MAARSAAPASVSTTTSTASPPCSPATAPCKRSPRPGAYHQARISGYVGPTSRTAWRTSRMLGRLIADLQVCRVRCADRWDGARYRASVGARTKTRSGIKPAAQLENRGPAVAPPSAAAPGARGTARRGLGGVLRPEHGAEAGEQLRHEARRARRVVRGPPPQHGVDRLPSGARRRVRAPQVHWLAHDAVVGRVQDERRSVGQDFLDDPHVSEAVVEQPVAVTVVRVVEEDQIARRGLTPAVQPAVAADVPADRLHAVVARRGLRIKIDARGGV